MTAGSALSGKPNVVVIIIDALRADRLGCYGFHEAGVSQELDAIAAEGALFEQAYSQSSWTRPSMACFLTSEHPRTLGISKERFDILPDRFATLPEILTEAGYHTIGLTANPNINTFFNFQQGFDLYQDSRVVWKWMEPGLGDEILDDEHHLMGSRQVLGTAMDLVRHAPKGKPVYLQVLLMDVHSPYLVRPEFAHLYSDYPVTPSTTGYSQEKLARLVRQTLGAIRQVSVDIHSFMQQLRARPGWENTLFILASDHGQGLDDHPGVKSSHGHGNLLYDSQLRIPLIWYHPGAHARFEPMRISHPVRLMDVMPTLLNYLGVRSSGRSLGGTSLLPLLRGQVLHAQYPDIFISETHWRDVDKISAASREWRLILNRDGWPGVNEKELQVPDRPQNGRTTDEGNAHPEELKRLEAYVDHWENRFPWGERVPPKGQLSLYESDQLKALGYLD